MIVRLREGLLRWEGLWLWALGALAFAAVPLWRGGIGLSWDALNHHIYLGWTAEFPRFDRDFWVAGSQSYQTPYLYWPVYRLALWKADGITAGVVLALLQSLAIPPVWRVVRRCCPGQDGFDVFTRLMATALAFLSGVVLVMLEVTSNDLLGAIPLLWAIAWALPNDHPLERAVRAPIPRSLVLSGLAAGVAVTLKLSNAPLAVVLPVLWMANARTVPEAFRYAVMGSLAALAGWLLTYGYWGWQLWHHFGNPVYPLYDGWFEPARQVLGWTP